jgi:flagellar operon protein
MSFRIERGQMIPIQNRKDNKIKQANSLDFQKLLQDSLKSNDTVKISAHAEQRMIERDIKLQESDMNLIKDAMNNLEKKGARESLMLYKDIAFIASVSNRTIITALQYKELDVVTNIDSTIIVE